MSDSITATVVVSAPPGSLVITPDTATVRQNGTIQFSANAAVTWSIQEGGAGGTIDATGLYTAPANAGTYHVVATVSVTPPAPSVSGIWTNVTPDNKGFCDVVADPARPSDFYAFSDRGGIYKSIDFGQTWVKINTGAGQAKLDLGNHWGVGIDPNPARNPATPPLLWTCNGQSADLGVWRSTDGGVNWTQSLPNNQLVAAIAGNQSFRDDAYSIDVDPTNNQHLIIGYHGFPGLSESLDGGVTWRSVVVPTGAAGIGDSIYPYFIDPSPAEAAGGATISTTWLTQAQWGTGNGMWRTIDSGATWTKVSTLEHSHGTAQLCNLTGGLLYIGGNPGPSNSQGVMRSTNYGLTWTSVYTAKPETGVIATPTKLYVSNGFAGVTNPNLVSASRAADTVWTAMPSVPAGITTGWKRAAVAFNGSNQVIVAGFRQSGIWRYVEP